ncbi:MAG: FAD-binding oxidoreductase [Thermoprotei archaeon]
MGYTTPLIEELSHIVEVVPEEEKHRYEADRWEYLKLEGAHRGRAIAVVRPKNEAEVVETIKFCAKNKLKLTCRGGGSSVTGASVPMDTLVLDMSRMNRVLRIDGENMVVNVEAGAKLSDVEEQLNTQGFTLGQFPQSFHLATIGGYLSTMGTGEFSGKYGGAEDSCLSLRVVLPDGSIVETRGTDAPRSSAGPDITRLFIGAEGSFGVILQAKLKIYRLSGYTSKLAFKFKKFEEGLSAAKALLELDVPPAVCRVYNEQESIYVFGEHSTLMLLIYQFRSRRVADTLLGEVVDTVGRMGGLEADSKLVDRWLDTRFKYDEQLNALHLAGYIVDTVELATSWSNLNPLYQEVNLRLSQIGGVVGLGTHASHIYPQGACLYFTVIMKQNIDAYTKLWDTVGAICKTHRATVSHHHGVGALKSALAKREVPYNLLEKIKQALDPQGLMNTNKLL